MQNEIDKLDQRAAAITKSLYDANLDLIRENFSLKAENADLVERLAKIERGE